MRRVFIPVKDRRTAKRRSPWAAVLVKVEGGFLAFESVADYEVWTAQR